MDIPIGGYRLPIHGERVELVGHEDLRETCVASSEADEARRCVDAQPARAEMHLPIGCDDLQLTDRGARPRDDHTFCAERIGCLSLG